MHIANVSGYLAKRFGGPPLVIKNFGKKHAELGNTVSYWATGSDPDRLDLVNEGLTNVNLFPISGIPGWHHSPNLASAFQAQHKSIDIAHLHEFWVHPVYAASRLCSRHHIPYVLSPHGSLEPWSLSHKATKKRLYMALFGKGIIRRANVLHAVTEKEFEAFKKLGYTGPTSIVSLGVGRDIYENLPPRKAAEASWPQLRDRPVLLYLSRISPEKGLDILIPAFAKFIKESRRSEVILVIAGPDLSNYKATLVKQILALGISSRVLFTGMVQGQQKKELYRRADVMVLPTHSENFGLVVPEALACETPVITTTGAPWQDLIKREVGFWVPPTSKDLFKAILSLYSLSEKERLAMGKRGREWVLKTFTWDISSRKMLTVYNCILNDLRPPLHPEPFPTCAR